MVRGGGEFGHTEDFGIIDGGAPDDIFIIGEAIEGDSLGGGMDMESITVEGVTIFVITFIIMGECG